MVEENNCMQTRIPFSSPSKRVAEANATKNATGLGFTDSGQPFAVGWPKCRKWPVTADAAVPQTLAEAFGWPSVVREEMKEHLKDISAGHAVVAAVKRPLQTTSHWSGICTQSRASIVLESNHVVACSFTHAPSLEKQQFAFFKRLTEGAWFKPTSSLLVLRLLVTSSGQPIGILLGR